MQNMESISDRLVAVAGAGKTIDYGTVAGWLGLDIASAPDRKALGRILDDIGYRENAAGRPLLSAVVVMAEIGFPGRNFFLLARELGFNLYADDRSYYYYELKRVHAYWKDHAPIPTELAYRPTVERPAKVMA